MARAREAALAGGLHEGCMCVGGRTGGVGHASCRTAFPTQPQRVCSLGKANMEPHACTTPAKEQILY